MPEQDSAVLDSPDALSLQQSIIRGGVSSGPVQQVKSPLSPAAAPPPVKLEAVSQMMTGQPALLCAGQAPPPTQRLPTPPRTYDYYKQPDVTFCRDFQNIGYCKRDSCNYIHSSFTDEVVFKESQKLSIEVIRKNSRILCTDFAEGNCKRSTSCKLWHIPANNFISLMESDDKKLYHLSQATNCLYVRPYNNNSIEAFSPDMQSVTMVPQQNNVIYQKPLTSMYSPSEEQQTQQPQQPTRLRKLFSRPNVFGNGKTFTNIATNAMIGNPLDASNEVPLPKYARINDNHKVYSCHECKEYEKSYDTIKQNILGIMDKVKEIEQSISTIATFAKTITDAVTRSETDFRQEPFRLDNGAMACQPMMQTAMGNHHNYPNYASPYSMPIHSQNHV